MYLTALMGLASILVIHANPLPTEATAEAKKTELHAYTVSNQTYSTIEQILEEVRANKGSNDDPTPHAITKR